MTRLRDESGVSLMELLTSIVIGLVVLGSGVTALVAYLGQSTTVDRMADAQDSARSAVDQLVIQLRSAASDGSGANRPVESISSSDLVFLAPSITASITSNPLRLQHVRYCLNSAVATNQVLWRQTATYNTGANAAPPARASCPASGWSEQTQVARNLVNTATAPLFDWTLDPSNGVSDVAVTAWVDLDPAAAPPATALRSSVTLRNLNRAPTAVLTCYASSNGHALCDASGSSDPDGQDVQYSWTVDGAAVAESSFRLDRASLAAGSMHTFQVTVADSGGLTASASRQVTMP